MKHRKSNLDHYIDLFAILERFAQIVFVYIVALHFTIKFW